MGHEDAFPRPSVSARCRFSQGTFAGASGNDEDAPKPVIPSVSGRRRSTPNQSFMHLENFDRFLTPNTRLRGAIHV